MSADPKATLTFPADIEVWGASLHGTNDPAVLSSERWPSSWQPMWHRGALWDWPGLLPWVAEHRIREAIGQC